jgi:hypothetical protein
LLHSENYNSLSTAIEALLISRPVIIHCALPQALRGSLHSVLLQLHQTHLVIVHRIAFHIHIHCLRDRRVEQARVHVALLSSRRLRWVAGVGHGVVAELRLRVVLRWAEALRDQYGEDSTECWHGYADYADVDLEDRIDARHQVVVHGVRGRGVLCDGAEADAGNYDGARTSVRALPEDTTETDDLHGADAKDRAEEGFLARAQVQFDQLRNWDQYNGHVETDVERSGYQVKGVLVDAVVRIPCSVPRSPYC